MAIAELNLHRFDINRPAFPVPSPEAVTSLFQNATSAIIYSGNSSADQIGVTVDEVASAMKLIKDKDSAGGKILTVTPDPAAAELERRGIRVIRPGQVLECVNLEKIAVDFGIDLRAVVERSGLSLLAGILFQRLVQKKTERAPKYNLLVQGRLGVGTLPLQWIGFYALNMNNPLMIQERQYHAAQEAMLYALPSYATHKGQAVREYMETIRRGWLGSSLILTVPVVLNASPNTTNIRAQDLILAFTAAAISRKTGKSLVQIGSPEPDPSVLPMLDDKRLIVTTTVHQALMEAVISRGRRMTEATDVDYQLINNLLRNAADVYGPQIGMILQPIDRLVEGGYILENKARGLVQEEAGRQWVAPERKRKAVLETTDLLSRARASGLLPEEPPTALGQLLTDIVVCKGVVLATRRPIFWEAQVEARPVCSVVEDPVLDELYRRLARLMLYNAPVDENGKVHPYHLDAADMTEIRDAVRDYLKTANVRVLVPFAGEEESLKGVLEYNSEVVGKEKVIAIDKEKSDIATKIAQKSGVRHVIEREHMSRVSWEKMKHDGILPEHFMPKGSKALTLLGGLIELAMQEKRGEINDDTMIIFHDSDIKNPYEYLATEYIGIPLLFHPEGHPPRTVHTAKAGQGRHNEVIHKAISRMMNSEDLNIQKIGFAATTAWPLAGERAIRWGTLKNIFWTNGMGIESEIDIWQASLDAMEGYCGTFEVGNPKTKEENRPSKPKREMDMIMGLARFIEDTEAAMKVFGDIHLVDSIRIALRKIEDITYTDEADISAISTDTAEILFKEYQGRLSKKDFKKGLVAALMSADTKIGPENTQLAFLNSIKMATNTSEGMDQYADGIDLNTISLEGLTDENTLEQGFSRLLSQRPELSEDLINKARVAAQDYIRRIRFNHALQAALSVVGPRILAKPISQWGWKELSLFNELWGGEVAAQIFANNEIATHVIPYITSAKIDYKLPSIQMMLKRGYLTLD